jgi:hypothetical protein
MVLGATLTLAYQPKWIIITQMKYIVIVLFYLRLINLKSNGRKKSNQIDPTEKRLL